MKVINILAMIIVTGTMLIFALSLFIDLKATESVITSIHSNLGNFVMFVLGFFYGSSKKEDTSATHTPQ